MPTAHSHVMGGSTATRRINCPGSYGLEKAIPDPPETSYATRGSMLHAAMELLIIESPTVDAEIEGLLRSLEGHDLGYGSEHTITSDLITNKLRPAYDAWLTLCDTYQLDDWFIEQQVSLEKILSGAFGTADIIAKDKDSNLHIIDWKFGDGVVVEVENNLGLGFYAGAALYDDDPEVEEFCANVNNVILHIVQPRAGDINVLHTWETTLDWVETVVDHVDNFGKIIASDKEAPLKAGDWCKFCKAKTVSCPVYTDMVSGALTTTDATDLTPIELGERLKTAYLLKEWIAETFKQAQAEMEQGVAIPGFKLVNKRPTRVWISESDTEAVLKRRKIKMADMYSKKLISPAQMEKKHKKLYKRTLEKMATSVSSGLTLVPDSDKRTAVSNTMELLTAAIPKHETETQTG